MTATIPSYRFPEAIRDRVLALCADVTNLHVLDVGCGDGLVGRALLPLVGPGGAVTFLDHDPDAIEELANDVRHETRAQMIVDDAERLATIDDSSVDLITMRALLLYVPDKVATLQSAARVLRPGGRIVISEPINRPLYYPAERFWGFDFVGIATIARKLQEGFVDAHEDAIRAMLDWDDVDLASFVGDSGFPGVRMETYTEIIAGQALPWRAFLHARWTPWMPSLAQIVARTLTPEEQVTFEHVARPQLAAGKQRLTIRNTFLTASHP